MWAVRRDRLRTARAVADLAGPDAGRPALEAFTVGPAGAVRPRPPRGPRPRLGRPPRAGPRPRPRPGVARGGRAARPSGPTTPVRRRWRCATPEGHLSFVYKAAAEIGELGDNTAALRDADPRRRPAAPGPGRARRRGRWCSATPAGPASASSRQPNAHPLNSEELGPHRRARTSPACLNGDVDNFADLKATDGLHIAAEITTDAKVIPTLCRAGGLRRRRPDRSSCEAFRAHGRRLDGSVAIAASAVARSDGSCWPCGAAARPSTSAWPRTPSSWPASPTGVVEETATLPPPGRRDARRPRQPRRQPGPGRRARRRRRRHPRGHRAAAPTTAPSCRWRATELAVAADHHPRHRPRRRPALPAQGDHRGAGVVPQDAAGQALDDDGELRRRASAPRRCPTTSARSLRDGTIGRVLVIGQGTAAVAGQSLAVVADATPSPTAACRSRPLPATELSGFALRADMSDTLVVAISQSGTTTDTNRTVDLVRARGATVIAIVNRRDSDLTDKSDGVLYTSDGRDVEMSVASTKAFYAQIAAGFLLAVAIAEPRSAGRRRRGRRAPGLLAGLRDLPDAMEPHPRAAAAASAAAAQRVRPSRALLGHRRQRRQPHRRRRRCGSSSRSSATSRSPATPPRTRSTSTCPRSR